MKHNSIVQGISQVKGVRQLCSQGECLMTPVQSLLWIAKPPEDQGYIGQAPRPRILPVEGGMGTMLLGIVEGHPLFQMRQGRDKVAQPVQGISHGAVPLQEE